MFAAVPFLVFGRVYEYAHGPAIVAGTGARPTLVAVLPGQYAPRLEAGMPLRLELSGYADRHDALTVASVAARVTSSAEARQALGPSFDESLERVGPCVVVTAELPSPSFSVDGRSYTYREGMRGTVDVRLGEERLLFTLAPAFRSLFGADDG